MAGSEMRKLVLLRHADAAARKPRSDDSERPLSEKGLSQSATVAREFATLRVRPDKVLLSDARRAQETWDTLARGNDIGLRPIVDHALYLAPPATVLSFIQSAGRASETLLVIGHNPGLTILAQALCDESSHPAAIARLSQGLPTAGFALFELSLEDWSVLAPGSARLTNCSGVGAREVA